MFNLHALNNGSSKKIDYILFYVWDFYSKCSHVTCKSLLHVCTWHLCVCVLACLKMEVTLRWIFIFHYIAHNWDCCFFYSPHCCIATVICCFCRCHWCFSLLVLANLLAVCRLISFSYNLLYFITFNFVQCRLIICTDMQWTTNLNVNLIVSPV